MRQIAFHRPFATGDEIGRIADAIERGVAGNGWYSQRCSHTLGSMTGAAHTLLTTSCTSALEMAASLLDIGPGDEVIMPSFTFVSMANAFVLRGARPVFVDIRPDTLNLDERLVEAAITPRTKALVVVHYAGVACEMDRLIELAAAHGLGLVEDTAHGLGATYRGRPLGSMGDLATLSFHHTKAIQCGEGGALLVNRDDLAPRAEIIREHGTNRGQFMRGEVDRYSWVDVGSSHVPAELLAAFLDAQLEHFEAIQARRTSLWNRYRDELGGWAEAHDIALPTVPTHCEHPAHQFHVLVARPADRPAFIDHLAGHSVHATFHYVPLHSSPTGRRLGGDGHPLPHTDDLSARLVRLPLYPDLTDDEQSRVIAAATGFEPAFSTGSTPD